VGFVVDKVALGQVSLASSHSTKRSFGTVGELVADVRKELRFTLPHDRKKNVTTVSAVK
jgi:hypothetical protein